MSRLNSVLVLILCITVSVACIASTQASISKVFSLPEDNGNIILPDNASYLESGTNYYYDNYTGLEIHVWYIPMFSTGSGGANLYVSAQNCNLTLNSYNQTTAPIETQFMYNVTNSIDCTVTGNGVARINLGSLDASNLAVYVNGVLRQEGDGWNLAGGYIELQGPADVTVYSSETEYWPPRGAPHDEFFYPAVLVVALAALVAIVGLIGYAYHRHRHNDRKAERIKNNSQA